MADRLPVSSDTARNRRRVLYADIVAVFLLVATGALFFASRELATSGRLSTLMNMVSQACAGGAALLLLAGLSRRSGSGSSLLRPVISAQETSERLTAQRVGETLYWKLLLLRPAVGIIVLQAALMAISAVLHL
ncbi:hypothetical protein ACGF0J_27250 [Nonomuraea sp. NPDC047897]|uniref:hypothetical protein n=1 Tax=Nonomuraea sp. NPDC047897 TaxID=3364346 RepID=UPI00371BDB02